MTPEQRAADACKHLSEHWAAVYLNAPAIERTVAAAIREAVDAETEACAAIVHTLEERRGDFGEHAARHALSEACIAIRLRYTDARRGARKRGDATTPEDRTIREAVDAETEACAEIASEYAARHHEQMAADHDGHGPDAALHSTIASHALLIRDRIRQRAAARAKPAP